MDVGEWVEPKLLTVYAVDDQGKKNQNFSFPSLMAPMMVTKGSFKF